MFTLAQWIARLTKGYIKATGKKPGGLAKLKIKQEAAAKVKAQDKVIQFPKDRITSWWKPRPGEKAATTSTPIKKSISDEAATGHVQKLKEELPFMSRKELHQLRADVVNRKAYGSFDDVQRRELLDALTNQFTNKPEFASGGVAGQLHLNQGGRARFQGGTPAVDLRMQNTYAENIAANKAQSQMNKAMRGLGNIGSVGGQYVKAFMGVPGTITSGGMDETLQNLIQKQIQETGKLSGGIDYKDYGVKTNPDMWQPIKDPSTGEFKRDAAGKLLKELFPEGRLFEGRGGKSYTSPEFALAATLGKADWEVDPKTGKVTWTGGTDYNFPEKFFGADIINRGGLLSYLGGPQGPQEFSPNVTLSQDFLKDYQPQQTSTPMMSQQDFYGQFWGVPYAGYEGQHFKTLQEGDPNYDEIRRSHTAGSFADLVDRGLVQRYEGPTDYNVYKSSFAKGGRIGYAQGIGPTGERQYNPVGKGDWYQKMPVIDPELRKRIEEYKKRKGLANILGV